MTYYDSFKPLLDHGKFSIPLHQPENSYFPEFLTQVLDDYILYYKTSLKGQIDDVVPFEDGTKDALIGKIISLSDALKESVNLYYQGKVLAATARFNDGLHSVYIRENKQTSNIEPGYNFYRARKDEGRGFNRQELFHVPFQARNIVSTTRYSIPGLPALYLGDSSYVCWEEFNRHRLRDLFFSRLSNLEQLKVFKLQRIEDLIKETDSLPNDQKFTHLFRYLILFPLTIACSIRVRQRQGSFRPEYIIPQLLLQNVSEAEDIDGIKFTSTQVDYSKTTTVPAYNYVFPVKTNKKAGYCDTLVRKFNLTEATSLELEEIKHNPTNPGMMFGDHAPDPVQIELSPGEYSRYKDTSFGKIETILNRKALSSIS